MWSAESPSRPRFWALHHGKDSRIFENATAPQIIEEVVKETLEPFGRTLRLNLTRPYAKREICTQYKESDWNFIQRLMADEGIFFYFEQGEKESDTETVVLVDSNDSCPFIETMGPLNAATLLPPLDEPNFLDIEMGIEGGGTLPDSERAFSLKFPDGTTRRATLNANGWASIAVGTQDHCQISFDTLDGPAWRRLGDRSDFAEPQSDDGIEHVVRHGECIWSIASLYRISWWRIWNHPNNRQLRTLRQDPGILLAGDRVFVPDRVKRWEPCSIAGANKFVRKQYVQNFALQLQNADGSVRSGVRFSFHLEGRAVVSGVSDHNGLIECTIPPEASYGRLTVRDAEVEEHYELLFGHLDPSSEFSGIQQRLNHLGFSCGDVDGTIGPITEMALSRFQSATNLVPTAGPDTHTIAALTRAHRR